MKDRTRVWELTEITKLEETKRKLQRLQIDKGLRSNFDALLLLLIRRGEL